MKDLWWHDALCKGMPYDIFFPPKGGSGRQAKAICALCPVQRECLLDAIQFGEPHGIRGGKTYKERLVIRRKLIKLGKIPTRRRDRVGIL